MILYFTGKGSSLKTAVELGLRLGDDLMVTIRHDMKLPAVENEEYIGLVCPVYDFGIPRFVLRWIDQLPPRGRTPYFFAVLIHGGTPCDAMGQLKRRLHRRKLKLDAGFELEFRRGFIDRESWEQQIDEIVQVVRRKGERQKIPTFKERLMTLMINPTARLTFGSSDKKFTVLDTCCGCGTCEKICPAGNIRIVDQRPEWRHHCEQCTACFTWCPQAAISGTNLAAKPKFHNFDVDLTQMLRQPNTKSR